MAAELVRQLLLDVQFNVDLYHSVYNCLNEYCSFSLPLFISVFVSVAHLNSVGRYCKPTVVVCNNYNLIRAVVFDSLTRIFTKISAVNFLLLVADWSDSF